MFEWLLERISEEWMAVKGAPSIFILAVSLIGTAIFFSLEWFHGEKTETQDQHIALLTDQKAQIERELEAQKKIVSAAIAESTEEIAESAELSILFWGDGHKWPAPVGMDNIWRWHVFFTGSGEWMTRKVTILIVFDPQIEGKKISISSPDFEIPTYRILEFNYRYAIVEFKKNFPRGTLIVKSN